MPTDPTPPELRPWSMSTAVSAVGSRRFERTLVTLVSVFGVLWSLQTVDSLFADWHGMSPGLGPVVVGLGTVSVAIGTAAVALGRRAHTAFLLAFLVFVVALVIWPLAIDRPVAAAAMPWLVALWASPAAYLAVALRNWAVALIIGVLVSVAVFAVLVTVGGQSWVDSLVNAFVCLVMSNVITSVVGGVRRGVEAADAAQQAALQRYAESRIDEAVEAERVRTDALVHDAVLTTFLSASTASDPASEALVVRMAQRAVRVTSTSTRSAEEGLRISFSDALERIRPEFTAVARHFDLLRLEPTQELFLPEIVAQAVVQAMLEAMAETTSHPGDGGRRSVVSTVGAGGSVRIEVRDDARRSGSDRADERARVPQPILERMREAGGDAALRVTPAGTAIVLTYPLIPAAHDRDNEPSMVLA